MASVRQVLSLGPELGEIVSSRPEIASSGQPPPALPSPTADAMAILPYSSGTTGTPKGTASLSLTLTLTLTLPPNPSRHHALTPQAYP